MPQQNATSLVRGSRGCEGEGRGGPVNRPLVQRGLHEGIVQRVEGLQAHLGGRLGGIDQLGD